MHSPNSWRLHLSRKRDVPCRIEKAGAILYCDHTNRFQFTVVLRLALVLNCLSRPLLVPQLTSRLAVSGTGKAERINFLASCKGYNKTRTGLKWSLTVPSIFVGRNPIWCLVSAVVGACNAVDPSPTALETRHRLKHQSHKRFLFTISRHLSGIGRFLLHNR